MEADYFSLQLLELASLLHDWYKAKRVVLGCILLRFLAHRSRKGLSPQEVRQYSGSVLHRADRAYPEAALHHSLEAQLKVYVSGKQERTLQ